jgi:hypothetical protein
LVKKAKLVGIEILNQDDNRVFVSKNEAGEFLRMIYSNKTLEKENLVAFASARQFEGKVLDFCLRIKR